MLKNDTYFHMHACIELKKKKIDVDEKNCVLSHK